MPNNNPPTERDRLAFALSDLYPKGWHAIADFILQEQRALLNRLEQSLGVADLTHSEICNRHREEIWGAIQAERGKLG